MFSLKNHNKIGTNIFTPIKSVGRARARNLGTRRSASHWTTAGRGRRRLLLEHRPVERVVVLVVEGAEQDAEQLAQVHVVGRLVKAQAAAVVQVHGELGREALRAHQPVRLETLLFKKVGFPM